MIDQSVGSDIGPASLYRRMEALFIDEVAIHALLREIIEGPMSFRGEVAEPLFL